ncbi:MAG: YIP1 family protein [Deltaproteobacteria bacterium]|nr:YIP1 family protein [Deltaproteobacteria bacterium]
MMGQFKLSKMIPRIKLMFSNPASFWDEMAGDQGGIKALLPTVLVFVSAVALAQFIGMMLMVLRSGLARVIHWFLLAGVIQLVLGVGLGVLAWYVLTVLITAFSKTFEATEGSTENASKVAFGAMLPGWLGGLLNLTSVGALGGLGSIAGFGFGCYLMYVGLQRLVGAPQQKSAGYTAAVMAIYFFVMLVVFGIVGGITGCVTACGIASSFG